MHESVAVLLPILKSYGYIIVFIGSILGGETVILAAAFLAFWGYLNLFWVIVVGIAGTILSDNLWYYIGLRCHSFLSRWARKLYIPRASYTFIKKNFDTHSDKYLILSKFVYGTRTATLILAGHQKISYWRFFILNIIGTLIWMVLVVAVGYGMGFSWRKIDAYSSFSHYWVIVLLLVFLVIRIGFNRLIKYINHE